MNANQCEECTANGQDKMQTFLMLFILGILIIFVGIITLIIAAVVYGEGSANFGGVIFIWFIPIVFGVGPESRWMVLFAVILAVLGFVMLLIMRNKVKV